MEDKKYRIEFKGKEKRISEKMKIGIGQQNTEDFYSYVIKLAIFLVYSKLHNFEFFEQKKDQHLVDFPRSNISVLLHMSKICQRFLFSKTVTNRLQIQISDQSEKKKLYRRPYFFLNPV